MSRNVKIAVMGASGVLMLAMSADQSEAQRRGWRRDRNCYPVSYSYNACCPQPVYSHACCPPGQFGTTGYASSQQYSSQQGYRGAQSQQPTPASPYAQQDQYGSTSDGQQADVPPAPPTDQGPYAEGRTGQSPQVAQGQSGPQQRMAMRPNLEESEQFQRMQEEIDSLKQQVNDLRQELDQLQSRRPAQGAEPTAPNEPAEGGGPAIPQGQQQPANPQGGQQPPASTETDAP